MHHPGKKVDPISNLKHQNVQLLNKNHSTGPLVTTTIEEVSTPTSSINMHVTTPTTPTAPTIRISRATGM